MAEGMSNLLRARRVEPAAAICETFVGAAGRRARLPIILSRRAQCCVISDACRRCHYLIRDPTGFLFQRVVARADG